MGLRDLFKVRKPGHGAKVEAAWKGASKRSKAWSVKSTDKTQNSGGKTPVK